MSKKTVVATSLTCAIAVVLSGCSSKASNSGDGGSGGSGDLKTEVGVTDSEIVLGVLTDSTGPFKVGSVAVTHGNELWVNEVNANGGICDRQVKLDIRDHGYKPDQAIPLYDNIKTTSIGLIQLLGSAVFAALKQKLAADNVLTSSPTIASVNLDTDIMLTVNPPFDVEMVNGMAFLMEEGLIKAGDKVGSIYMENEAGQNGQMGVQAFAKEHDLQLVEVAISASDTDLTATVTKLKSDGVQAVTLATTPGALTSVALQMRNQGLNVPIYGFHPVFQPSVLSDPQVVAALDNFYVTEPNTVWDSENENAVKLREAYEEAGYTDLPSASTTSGYISGLAWGAVLEQACEDGDMTRAGIQAAKAKVTSLETGGLSGTLDFSNPGAPVTRENYMAQIDAAATGGLKEVSELTASDEAEAYKTPYE